MQNTSSLAAGFALALLCTSSVTSQPIAVDLVGTINESADDLSVFPNIGPGDAVSVRVVLDTSLPNATTIFVESGETEVLATVLAPVASGETAQFFGVLPDIAGIDADGGVTISLDLPTTNPLDAAAFNGADLATSFGRVSYASLISVDPLVIDESVFSFRFDSVQAELLDTPTALCRPVDLDQNGTVDSADRDVLVAAVQSVVDGAGAPDVLDLDGDGEVTANDLGEAVFLLNRCSNEGPNGQPLVDVFDLTGDTAINILDLVLFIELFNNGDIRADVDSNETVDFFDFIAFLDGFDRAVLL